MTRLIVVTGFIIAFGAGLMLGRVMGPQRPGAGGGDRRRPDSVLAQQLDLTADQQMKLRQIWSEVSHRGGPPQGSGRQQIRREQELAIAKLIRPEDTAAYDAIVKNFRDRIDAIESDNRRSYAQAVEKTKELLTPEQRVKYEKIVQQRPWEHGDHDRPASASTGPATEPK